jgi:hypothetical protein
LTNQHHAGVRSPGNDGPDAGAELASLTCLEQGAMFGESARPYTGTTTAVP